MAQPLAKVARRGQTGFSLGTMRALALALLLAMFALFIAARLSQSMHPAIPFVRAFAEAATVGALADWFAVTALFRRPLGLPIPHTAIIPRSKDRIGEGLGRFLEGNFLDPLVIERQLQGVDLSGAAMQWLASPKRRSSFARSLAQSLPHMIDLANDPKIARALGQFALGRLERLDAATALADLLGALTAGDRHQQLLERAVDLAHRTLEAQEPEIRRRVRQETGWFSRLIAVDRKAADAMVGAIRSTIQDIAADPHGPWRAQFAAYLAGAQKALREDDNLRREIAAAKHAILSAPEVAAYLASLWDEIRADLRRSALVSVPEISLRIEAGAAAAAGAIERDPDLREAINERLRSWAILLARARGGDVAAFVAQTVKGWDASTVIDRIESGVGRDLQYIRISGTLIGGLVGVGLHLVSMALPHGG